MNEIIAWLHSGCDLLLKLSATSFFVVASWAIYRAVLKENRVSVWFQTTPSTATTGTSTAQVAVAAQDAAPEPVPERIPLLENEKETEEDDTIVCGSCLKDIKSEPVTRMTVDGADWNVYVCEHCQAQVKLPVTG